MGGKLHLKLETCLRPMANKYCEGKMQRRTLKRELKVPEIAGREVSWTSCAAHGAGIHVNVCVVACFVCQNQFCLKLLE